MSEAPSPFFSGTTLQYAWDSTSLSLLMECPRKYFYTLIEGWRKRDESVHLRFGGEFALAMEDYAHAISHGMTHDAALECTVQDLLERTYDWNPDNSPKKNRETLLRTVIWYFEEYRDDPAKTIVLASGAPATELSFKFELGITASPKVSGPAGSEYLYCGHLDRLVDFGGDVFVMDQKTTGGALGPYYFSQFDLSNQMSGYTYAGQVAYNSPVKGVIIDAAALLVGSTSFARYITPRTSGQLSEWVSNVEQHLRFAEHYAESGVYPMNTTACSNYGGCVFKSICSKDPSVRKNYLQTEFEKRPWNPLQSREATND